MSPLAKRWLVATVAIFVIIFGLILAIRIKQDLEYASGNEYASEHLSKSIYYSVKSSAGNSLTLTASAGQAFFWIIEGLLHHKRKSSPNKKPLSPVTITVIIVILIITTLIVTAPLWFRIPS